MEDKALRWKQSGNDAFQHGDYEAAVEHYSSAIKLNATSVLHSNRAAAYIMLGWWEQALRDTKVALRKDGSNQKALDRKGRCLFYLDRFDEVLDVMSEFEKRAPQSETNNGGIPKLCQLVSICRQPHSLEECRQALEEIGTRNCVLSPVGLRVRKALVQALLNKSDVIENPRSQMIEGQVAVQDTTSYIEEALHMTAELLQDYPGDSEVSCLRGHVLVRSGRRKEAESQLQQSLQESPDHMGLKELSKTLCRLDEFLRSGNSFYKDGQFAQAIQAYTAGVEADIDCTDVQTCSQLYYNRAAAYRRLGEFRKALDDVNMSLVLSPRWAKALYRRGILLLECGQAAQALAELKIAQRADPTLEDDLGDWLRRAHCFLAKPKDEKNHYELMRLPMDATKDDIKRQYKRLCLLWHPDKNQTEDGMTYFSELQESFAFLMNDDQRSIYDYGKWKDREVSHYRKHRTKAELVGDDVITVMKEQPWIQRTREGREWLEVQLEKDITEDPEWLEEKTKEMHSRWYSQEIEEIAAEALQAVIS